MCKLRYEGSKLAPSRLRVCRSSGLRERSSSPWLGNNVLSCSMRINTSKNAFTQKTWICGFGGGGIARSSAPPWGMSGTPWTRPA